MSGTQLSRARHKARKLHRCDQCGQQIGIGEVYEYSAGLWEGDFVTAHAHLECEEAWNKMAFDLHDLNGYDEFAPYLCAGDWDPEDRQWMCDEYPVVAARLGWQR